MPLTLQELEQALKEDPRSRLFHPLAAEYRKMGKLEEAKALLEKGLGFFPTHIEARILLAQIYLGAGNLDAAKSMVDRVLLVVPDHVSANHLAADIHHALGHQELALKHYRIVELFEPGRPGVKEKLRVLTGKGPEPTDPPPPAPIEDAEAEPETEREPETRVKPDREPEPEEAQEPEAGDQEDTPEPPAPIETSKPEPRPEPEPLPPKEMEEPELGGIFEEEGALEELEAEPPPTTDMAEARTEGGPVWEEPVSHGETARILESAFGEEVTEEPSPLEEGDRLEDESLLDSGDGLGEAFQEDRQTEEEGEWAPPHASAETPGTESGDSPLSTSTLAQLYERQGYPEKAIEIYQRLLLRNPEDRDILKRIQELMRKIEGSQPEGEAVAQEEIQRALRQRRVRVLRDWLRRVKEDRHVS